MKKICTVPRLPGVLCIIFFIVNDTLTFDNAHFYRPPYFFSEPRLECPQLATIEATLAGGRTSSSRNSDGNKVSLLDLYGSYNIHALAKGVPDLDPTNVQDLALIALSLLEPTNDTFGRLSYHGYFNIIEGNIIYTQNFNCGFFAQTLLPLRKLKITDISYCDLTPEEGCPSTATPEWQTVVSMFDAIMKRHNLDLGNVDKSGFGDLTIFGGWTLNYDQTEWLDFVDTTLKLGVLFPTGKKSNSDKVFDIPLGYDGHVGFAGSFACALGCYEWLTLGGYADFLTFCSRTKKMRVKTSIDQSGLIKLAKTSPNIKPGELVNIGVFAKADHVCRGISALVGYTYTRRGNSVATGGLCSCESSSAVINSDESLHGWRQHTLHCALELDLNRQEDSRSCTRVGLFWNHLFKGTRVFGTNIIGGSVSIDVTLSF